MKISIVQMKPKFLDLESNFNTMKAYYEKSGSDVILYPELCLSGYNFDNKNEVETCALTEFSKIIKYFLDETRKNDNAVAFGTVFKKGDKFYNSQIFIAEDEIVIYDKVNLFNRENLFFTPGKKAKVVEFKGYKFGMSVCFDWFNPEFFRDLAKNGADVILHSANLVMPYCQQANITRSIENRVYIATANRIGEERGLYFTGMSQITDPYGKILIRLGEDLEGAYEVDIDPLISRDKKLNDFNNIF
jgi:predicted amidohydrolase